MTTRTIARVAAIVLGLLVSLPAVAEAMPVGAWRFYEPPPPLPDPPPPEPYANELVLRLALRAQVVEAEIVRLSVTLDHGGPGRKEVRGDLLERLMERHDLQRQRDEAWQLFVKQLDDGTIPESRTPFEVPGQ